MIFDKLAGIVERHFPHFKDMMTQAKLFQFEGIPHHILPALFSDKTSEEVDDICNSFFLPYKVTAIEDGASCIIIADRKDNQTGIDAPRFFLEATIPSHNKEYYDFKVSNLDTAWIEEMRRLKVVIINYGIGEVKSWNKDIFGTTGEIYGAMAVNKKDIIIKDICYRLDEKVLADGCLQNFTTALQEIMFFNQPDKFILEKRPAKEKKVGKGWIRRSIHRPVYTILHPAQIRHRMNLISSIRGPIAEGFDRRRHIRYLSHVMYSKDDTGADIQPKIIPNGPRRGETYYKSTVIQATWVGPSESTVGNKRYKVILDR